MFRSLFIYLFIVLICWSCSNGPQDVAGTGSESPNALTGVVYAKKASSDCISTNALVTIYSIDTLSKTWEVFSEINTNDSGKFTVTDLQKGRYSILIEKDTLNAFTYFDYFYNSGKILIDSILLKEKVSITGKINDQNDNPIKNAQLKIVGTGFKTITGDFGEYEFTDLASDIIYNCQLQYRDSLDNSNIFLITKKEFDINVIDNIDPADSLAQVYNSENTIAFGNIQDSVINSMDINFIKWNHFIVDMETENKHKVLIYDTVRVIIDIDSVGN